VPTNTRTPSLKDIALDRIGELAAELRKSDPSLSREQAVSAVMKTAAGREAYGFYAAPDSHLAWPAAIAHLAKGEGFRPASMRDAIIQKRQLAKEGGAGGSGPRGGMIEDPKRSGPKTPSDTLPAQPNGRKVTSPITPADAIYAGIRAAALRAAPTGTSEAQAIDAYVRTSEGQAAHARWNAARGQ
jgi:hypothetical protein